MSARVRERAERSLLGGGLTQTTVERLIACLRAEGLDVVDARDRELVELSGPLADRLRREGFRGITRGRALDVLAARTPADALRAVTRVNTYGPQRHAEVQEVQAILAEVRRADEGDA